MPEHEAAELGVDTGHHRILFLSLFDLVRQIR
jgi:hypothetical protein